MSRRVVHVINWLGYGGIERWLLGITPYITKAGWQVTFVAKGANAGPLSNRARALGCDVVHAPLRRGIVPFVRSLRSLTQHSDQVVFNSHLHDLSGLVNLAATGPSARAPVIASFHNTVFHSQSAPWPLNVPYLRRSLLRPATKWTLKASTLVTGCSQAVLDALDVDRDRSAVVPYGVETHTSSETKEETLSALGVRSDAFVSVFVGRLVDQKNPIGLVKAFAQVKQTIPAAVLLIVGDGPLRGAVQQEVGYLGLHASVHFLGQRGDALDIMAASDLLVLPSRHEGFGLVVLEAALMGTPGLVAAVPGLTEAASGCGSFLTSPHDTSVLAHDWASMGDPTRDLKILGAQCKALAETNHSLQRSAARYLEVLDAVSCDS